ncbi:L-tryptophan--pyruvate aminotransferase 1-like protein [Cinnamomum micranthum f. kanehirae]|uniref:L-tryptophan--pyruvate aminotransferase 1-like protein n=1 Tax=Cinnamomum micranthum f. kanehirae TaxID=337451 RepID=A0A443PTH2_9MAGN|nr:L-tryptophan--pyruvate aminotransferase 1-like protein [Cinnamomum micranthum f. kanehirae]
MFESFWRRAGDKCSILIPGWQKMSYFSDSRNMIHWFLELELADEVRKMHRLVGNAIVDDRHIVVGAGSTQLLQAALYALSDADAPQPMNVVTAVPYYSEAVVNRAVGKLIHDLTYYWPQYTPITTPADHDLMLFTSSKSTGHAGTRIGWALVKDPKVAKRMSEFLVLSSIGVSKDSQLQAAKILRAVREGYEGFAWLKYEKGEDGEDLLRKYNIVVRSGKHFGVGPEYVRASMIDRDETFDLLIERLLEMQ